jgi:hypothetical protein
MGSVGVNGQFTNLNTDPTTFVLMVVGSPTVATTLNLGNGATATSPMAIYAPRSTLNWLNDLNFTGAMVVRSFTVQNNTDLTYDPRLANISGYSAIRLYQRTSYKECTSVPPAAAPDSGC